MYCHIVLALCSSQSAGEIDGIASPRSGGNEYLYIYFAVRKYESMIRFVIFSINGGGAGTALCKQYSRTVGLK